MMLSSRKDLLAALCTLFIIQRALPKPIPDDSAVDGILSGAQSIYSDVFQSSSTNLGALVSDGNAALTKILPSTSSASHASATGSASVTSQSTHSTATPSQPQSTDTASNTASNVNAASSSSPTSAPGSSSGLSNKNVILIAVLAVVCGTLLLVLTLLACWLCRRRRKRRRAAANSAPATTTHHESVPETTQHGPHESGINLQHPTLRGNSRDGYNPIPLDTVPVAHPNGQYRRSPSEDPLSPVSEAPTRDPFLTHHEREGLLAPSALAAGAGAAGGAAGARRSHDGNHISTVSTSSHVSSSQSNSNHSDVGTPCSPAELVGSEAYGSELSSSEVTSSGENSGVGMGNHANGDAINLPRKSSKRPKRRIHFPSVSETSDFDFGFGKSESHKEKGLTSYGMREMERRLGLRAGGVGGEKSTPPKSQSPAQRFSIRRKPVASMSSVDEAPGLESSPRV